jgi:RNA polymerase sigma factor (sigma-70 family)
LAISTGLQLRQVGESDGDEIVAETFTLAFAARSRFNTEGSARAWLFGICANVMRGNRRSASRRRRAYERAYEGDYEDSSEEAIASALDAERQSATLRRAIAALRPAEREVLLLHALGGLSGVEIAEALALAPSTVRSHLFRARSSLRPQLRNGTATDETSPTPVDLWRSR